MDVKEYISSGIIESYVLGVVSDQERREVECMSKIYPEILEELNEVNAQFEVMAGAWSKTPPAELKNKVLEAIKGMDQDPAPSSEEKEAKIVSLPQSRTIEDEKPFGHWKLIAAAAVLIALAMSALFVKSKTELDDTSQLLAETQAEVESVQSQFLASQEELQMYQQEKDILVHEATTKVQLSGLDISPSSKMSIFWNNEVDKVMMAGVDLPKPSTELQYQLWAIDENGPVDLGVFDVNENGEIISKDINIKNVQAFAVTLETKGGNPTPNLEKLYVIGNV